MSTFFPSPIRIAQIVREIGDLHLRLARELEASGASASEAVLRSFVLELVRSVLTDLGLLPAHAGADPAPNPPLHPEPEPQPELHPDEDPMSILRRDFGYAHVRFAMKQDEAVVETSSGFERRALLAIGPNLPSACHDDDHMFASVSPEPLKVPPNTKLVRLHLSADHQIDPAEVVAMAVPADRDTAYRYDVKAIAVDDRTIDVTVRRVDPDINETLTLARVDVVLFRIA